MNNPCPNCGAKEQYRNHETRQTLWACGTELWPNGTETQGKECIKHDLAVARAALAVAEYAAELVQSCWYVGCVKSAQLDCLNDHSTEFDSGVELDPCPSCLLAQAYAIADSVVNPDA